MRGILYSVIMCISVSLYTTGIISIDSITNERTVINYNEHSGAVYSYENRLIVSGRYGIEEYEILPHGGLDRISFHEKSYQSIGYLYDDKYYDVEDITYRVEDITYDESLQITIFDV